MKKLGLLFGLVGCMSLETMAMNNGTDPILMFQWTGNNTNMRQEDIPAAKEIMRMLQQDRSDLFVNGVENLTNRQEGLAYDLGSAGQGLSTEPKSIEFHSVHVNMKTGMTSMGIHYCTGKYEMHLQLKGSYRMFTTQGSQYFQGLAKKNGTFTGR